MKPRTRLPGLSAAEQFFRERISLTGAMGLRVLSTTGGFVVEAPVAPNSNHLGTAFGGSIHAIALLAGYGLLWTELQDLGADIVVRESSIRFLHPIRIVIHAECARPPAEEMRLVSRATDRAKARPASACPSAWKKRIASPRSCAACLSQSGVHKRRAPFRWEIFSPERRTQGRHRWRNKGEVRSARGPRSIARFFVRGVIGKDRLVDGGVPADRG